MELHLYPHFLLSINLEDYSNNFLKIVGDYIIINNIQNVSKNQMEDILKFLKNNKSTFIAEIKGKEIQTQKALSIAINKVFGYYIPFNDINGWINWIRNIDWLKKDNYVLIIYNYEDFMSKDLEIKKTIKKHFECITIPWWNAGLEDYEEHKEYKAFNIYIVD